MSFDLNGYLRLRDWKNKAIGGIGNLGNMEVCHMLGLDLDLKE